MTGSADLWARRFLAGEGRPKALLTQLSYILAPQEYLDLAAQARRAGQAERAALMLDSDVGRDLAGQARLSPYRRVELSADATLYRADSGQPRGHLLIGFCGAVNRMMLPTPIFLQYTDDRRFDVLLLRDPARSHFRLGCAGFGGSFVELVAELRRRFADYPTISAMGASMGGLAAIRFGVMAGVPAVSLGGRPPDDTNRIFARQGCAPAFDLLCDCLPRHPRPLAFVHSAGCVADRRAARAVAALTGGRAVPVPGVAQHNMLAELWLRRDLAPAMDALAALAQGRDTPAWRAGRRGLRGRIRGAVARLSRWLAAVRPAPR